MKPTIHRRDWLADTLQMAAASSAATVLGLPSTRAAAPSETIRLGVLGAGGRSRHLMRSLVNIPGLKIVALADVRDDAPFPSPSWKKLDHEASL